MAEIIIYIVIVVLINRIRTKKQKSPSCIPIAPTGLKSIMLNLKSFYPAFSEFFILAFDS
jgi:hypothetical protein